MLKQTKFIEQMAYIAKERFSNSKRCEAMHALGNLLIATDTHFKNNQTLTD